jgi:hypothetical protein
MCFELTICAVGAFWDIRRTRRGWVFEVSEFVYIRLLFFGGRDGQGIAQSFWGGSSSTGVIDRTFRRKSNFAKDCTKKRTKCAEIAGHDAQARFDSGQDAEVVDSLYHAG